MLLYASMVVATIVGMLFQEFPNTAVNYLLKYTSLGNSVDGSFFMHIFVNNLTATFLLYIIMVFYAEKNFKALLKIYPIYIGIIGGVAISFNAYRTNIVYSTVLIIPHGIIEIAMICFTLNSGYFFYKKEYTLHEKASIFTKISVILVLGILVAAYIEADITRNLASPFL